jgi:hypothetical protein
MMMVGFIIVVGWSAFVLTAAGHHGRVLHRAHRAARAIFLAGIALTVPVIVAGACGLPAALSHWWLGVLVSLGYAGFALAAAGALFWLISDSVFIWQHRRKVFSFAFRRPPGGEQ